VRFATDRYLLLPLGAAIALVWANTAGESYFRFAHAIAFPVNEIGMALFFALVAQEVYEGVMPGGALHTWRKWVLPITGALGGCVGAALTYLAWVSVRHEQVLLGAWPVATAVDVAAAYYLLKLIYRRGSALPFMLLTALTSNVLGLVALALWAPVTAWHVLGGALVLAAAAAAALFHRGHVKRFLPYLVLCGTVSWVGCYLAGVHPALALMPLVPFLPHTPRRLDLLSDVADDSPVHHAEHEWHEAVQVVLFLFGLANAGVILRGYDTATWAMLAAALVGRPAGMLAAVALACAAGLHLPRSIRWRDLWVIAFATSAGFTIALFLASAMLAPGAMLQQVKVGALATVAGALIAFCAARVLAVGRFAHR
jgi:NhaA family Na+:H+ antiporter